MKYRIFQCLQGTIIRTVEVESVDDIRAAAEVRGFTFRGTVRRPPPPFKLKQELIGQPVFNGLVGPLWEPDACRYEDEETAERLSS